MTTLATKLRRDLRRSRWQFAAVTTMVVLGITFFVSLLGSMDNLRLSIDRPYADLHFADFIVSFDDAPEGVVERIASIAGVERISGRINLEVPATFPGRNSDIIAGRIITLPVPDRPQVDDLLLTEGRYPTNATEEVAIAEENFAEHHGLRVGDAVEITTAAGPRELRIGGVAISPEYLWPARSAPEHMPDVLRRWGVLFVPYSAVAPLFGLNGSINQIVVTVRQGADRSAVVDQVREILGPYRISAVVPREEQPSELILETFVNALDTLSIVFPLFFLSIVAMSTYVLLTRLVHSQRQQVGVLLALGLTRRRVLAHYWSFSIVIGLLGSTIGIVAGYGLSEPVSDLFAQQISLPLVYKVPHWDVMAVGVALSLAFTSLAGVGPAYRASLEKPAETMRGEIPRNGLRLARRRKARHENGRVSTRLPYRNLKRNPVRSAFTILALGLAGSLIIVPFGFLDAMDGATAASARMSNFDLKVLLYQPVPTNMTDEAGTWDEVAVAEPFATLPVVLERSGETFNVVLYGLETKSDAFRLFSRDGNRVSATSEGVLLDIIFEKRGLRVGDPVRLGPVETRIAGFVNAFSPSGFLPIETVQANFLAPGLMNGLFVTLDAGSSEEAVTQRLYASLPVWSIASKAKSLQDWNDMLRLYYGFIGIIVAFGLALAAAIVFNAVTINVLERNREIATMRTIGVNGARIRRIITTENLLMVAFSIVLGSVIGTFLTGYFVSLFGSDIFVLEANVYPQTYALSALLVVGVMFLSQNPSLRHVQRLDLAKATKERAG